MPEQSGEMVTLEREPPAQPLPPAVPPANPAGSPEAGPQGTTRSFPPSGFPGMEEGGPSRPGPLYGAVRPFLPDDSGTAPTAAEGAPSIEPSQGVSPYPYLDNQVIGGEIVLKPYNGGY